ncbi:MAG TPA: glycosyltransferase family 4 protein [Vicinamibacteria bacterium]|nr:glycosyltransferase family 4 protein [Vicinamibacteria bacterium]
MRILWVATKVPWPPVDGGRLVAAVTLEALRAGGHEPTVVAPVDPRQRDRSAAAARREGWRRVVLVPARPLPSAWAALCGSMGRVPFTVRRRAFPRVRDAVAALLERATFDVAHAEQLQALGSLAEAERRRLPVVLRAQNVESDLWRRASRTAPVLGPLLRREAERLAAWEAEGVRRSAATIALASCDAARLAELAGVPDRVRHVPAPFPSRLPPAEGTLPGSPAVVLFGSEGWRPNREGARWFVDRVWPRVRAVLPQAELTVLGLPAEAGPGVRAQPGPADSRDAFAEGAVLVVPLHVASGVRMKIVEAWARGMPVVATPVAAQGLEATHGRELLLARDAEGFADALRRLHGEPGLAAALVAAGRDRLAARHEPADVAARLVEVYASARSSDGA